MTIYVATQTCHSDQEVPRQDSHISLYTLYLGKIGSVASKDRDFRKIPLKDIDFVKYH